MNKLFKIAVTSLAITIALTGCSGDGKQKASNDAQSDAQIDVQIDVQSDATASSETSTLGSFDWKIDATQSYEVKDVEISLEGLKAAEIDFSDIGTHEVADIDFGLELEEIGSYIIENIETHDASKVENMTIEQKEYIIETREALLKEMITALADNKIQAKMDTVSGELTMDASILFDVDKADVSDEGKEFLRNFIPIYTSIICDKKYEDFIAKVLIEGHTDTDGSYDYNKKLSQDRADNVAEFSLSQEIDLDEDVRAIFESLVSAEGCSYDSPIKDDNGNVDMEASRRVTFRFMINLD